jgi:hypothetical protein
MDTENVRHIHNGILFNHKKNKFLSFITTWMELEITTQSEMTQAQRQVSHDLTHVESKQVDFSKVKDRMVIKKGQENPAPVAHICNPSYSGGRDKKNRSSKPAQTNSSLDPISKNPVTKNWADEVPQGEGPEFKPQYHKKERRGENRREGETRKDKFCSLEFSSPSLSY